MSTATPEAARVLPAPPPAPRAKRRNRRLVVVFAVLGCAAGFLLYKTLTSAVVYFKTAAEAVTDRGALGNSTFQIEGVVVPGSVHTTAHSVVGFRISSGSTTVAVNNSADPPALFQPNIPVVLVGHFVGTSDVFSSDQIIVKHSNQYIAAHPNRVRGPNGQTH